MSRRTEREDFIVRLAKAGVRPDDSRKLLRYARTLHRLAEAQCNGYWPADNGQREVKPCAQCEGLWAPSVLKRHPHHKPTAKGPRYCPDCRTETHVRDFCERLKLEPVFGGDPRGCVLKLKIPGDRGNDFGGEGLVCVP